MQEIKYTPSVIDFADQKLVVLHRAETINGEAKEVQQGLYPFADCPILAVEFAKKGDVTQLKTILATLITLMSAADLQEIAQQIATILTPPVGN